MNRDGMTTTPWHPYTEDRAKHRIRVEYGWSKLGEQDPYWSVTGEIARQARNNRWQSISFGCLHDQIAKRFPRIAPSIRWHLCSQATGPMHYIENAIYWYEKIVGCSKWEQRSYDPDPTDAFKRTVVFGALADDVMPEMPGGHASRVYYETPEMVRAMVRTVITAWCEARLPRLLEAMRRETDAVLASDKQFSEVAL